MGGRETGGGGRIFTTEPGASFAAEPYVLILSSEEHTGECLFERLGSRRKKPPICSAGSLICSYMAGRMLLPTLALLPWEGVGAGAELVAAICTLATGHLAELKSPLR